MSLAYTTFVFAAGEVVTVQNCGTQSVTIKQFNKWTGITAKNTDGDSASFSCSKPNGCTIFYYTKKNGTKITNSSGALWNETIYVKRTGSLICIKHSGSCSSVCN